LKRLLERLTPANPRKLTSARLSPTVAHPVAVEAASPSRRCVEAIGKPPVSWNGEPAVRGQEPRASQPATTSLASANHGGGGSVGKIKTGQRSGAAAPQKKIAF